MTLPAVTARKKSTKRSRRMCHVCKHVLPTNTLGYKFTASEGPTGTDRVVLWLCKDHGDLFLSVMNSDGVAS